MIEHRPRCPYCNTLLSKNIFCEECGYTNYKGRKYGTLPSKIPYKPVEHDMKKLRKSDFSRKDRFLVYGKGLKK